MSSPVLPPDEVVRQPFARYGHPPVDEPFDDPEAAMQFALHHSRTTGEPVEVHNAGRATVYRRPSWRDA